MNTNPSSADPRTHELSPLAQARQRMEAARLPSVVINNFERLLTQVVEGKTGIIPEESIESAGTIDSLAKIKDNAEYARQGEAALNQLSVVRLNGGLGTSMGMSQAKSLLPVRGNQTFNEIMINQLRSLRTDFGVTIPLIHMTSFSTDADIRSAMEAAPDLHVAGLPPVFQQHKHPKVYADSFLPAQESDDELNWNPPGHGDIYAALIASGVAEELLAQGKRYMFVANSDNLGATVNPTILGYMIESKSPFLMETCLRTKDHSKGGHLARDIASGRLLLREVAQAPRDASGQVIPEFSNIERYNQFNTNNIWLDLQAVVDVAKQHDGCIPLPLISNAKTVNPRDKASRKVIQIESAMGAAIQVFEGAKALQVGLDRFMPVKTNNELLLTRSDVFVLTRKAHMIVNPDRVDPALPSISLDAKYFGMIQDFSDRVKVVPSLRRATSLTVAGDVVFDRPVEIVGDVTILGDPSGQRGIPANISRLENTQLRLG